MSRRPAPFVSYLFGKARTRTDLLRMRLCGERGCLDCSSHIRATIIGETRGVEDTFEVQKGRKRINKSLGVALALTWMSRSV